MNSLEFINKQIDVVKKQLAKYPLSKEQSNPNYKYKEADIQYIHNKFYTEQLQTLQQIKAELESWKFVKEEVGFTIENIEGSRSSNVWGCKYGLKYYGEGIIPLSDKEVESFKKALKEEKNDCIK